MGTETGIRERGRTGTRAGTGAQRARPTPTGGDMNRSRKIGL